MPQHQIHLHWDTSIDEERYTWTLDNGIEIQAADPSGVITKPDFMDPEEAFLAAICSCHLLSFVTEAAREGYSVKSYQDHPAGMLAKNAQGRLFVGKVLLAPRVVFAGPRMPNAAEIESLHEKAREKCIISNSVLTEITLTPDLSEA
jgi:organic hydroperoxide reductase OsmC/OhrA